MRKKSAISVAKSRLAKSKRKIIALSDGLSTVLGTLKFKEQFSQLNVAGLRGFHRKFKSLSHHLKVMADAEGFLLSKNRF